MSKEQEGPVAARKRYSRDFDIVQQDAGIRARIPRNDNTLNSSNHITSSMDQSPKSCSASSEWGTVTLLPEILPHVVRQLDPQDSDDLSSLLVIQRCCEHGWRVSTPLIYKTMRVQNWSHVLHIPVDASGDADTSPPPSIVRSISRRLLAFQHVKTLSMEEFLPMDALNFTTQAKRCGLLCDGEGGNTRQLWFPNTDNLIIESDAFKYLWPQCAGIMSQRYSSSVQIPLLDTRDDQMPDHTFRVVQPSTLCISSSAPRNGSSIVEILYSNLIVAKLSAVVRVPENRINITLHAPELIRSYVYAVKAAGHDCDWYYHSCFLKTPNSSISHMVIMEMFSSVHDTDQNKNNSLGREAPRWTLHLTEGQYDMATMTLMERNLETLMRGLYERVTQDQRVKYISTVDVGSEDVEESYMSWPIVPGGEARFRVPRLRFTKFGMSPACVCCGRK